MRGVAVERLLGHVDHRELVEVEAGRQVEPAGRPGERPRLTSPLTSGLSSQTSRKPSGGLRSGRGRPPGPVSRRTGLDDRATRSRPSRAAARASRWRPRSTGRAGARSTMSPAPPTTSPTAAAAAMKRPARGRRESSGTSGASALDGRTATETSPAVRCPAPSAWSPGRRSDPRRSGLRPCESSAADVRRATPAARAATSAASVPPDRASPTTSREGRRPRRCSARTPRCARGRPVDPACSPRASSASRSSSTCDSSNGTVHLPSGPQPGRLRRTWLLTVPSGRSSRLRDLVVREVVVEREPQDGALRVAQPVELVGHHDAVGDAVVDGRHALGRDRRRLVPQAPVPRARRSCASATTCRVMPSDPGGEPGPRRGRTGPGCATPRRTPAA